VVTAGFHDVFAITGVLAVAAAVVAVILMGRPTASAEPSLPADLATTADQATSPGDIDVS